VRWFFEHEAGEGDSIDDVSSRLFVVVDEYMDYIDIKKCV